MKSTQLILTQFLLAMLIFSCGNEPNEIDSELESVEDTLVSDLRSDDVLSEIISVAYNQDSLEICIDSIWNCQKVVDKNGDWRESSNGEMGLSMMQIDGEDRIYLDFGENNEFRFVNYWNFIVEPTKGYRISFYNVVKDENIDFGDWCE